MHNLKSTDEKYNKVVTPISEKSCEIDTKELANDECTVCPTDKDLSVGKKSSGEVVIRKKSRTWPFSRK